MDLVSYQMEMQPIPERVEEAIRAGVRYDISFDLNDAPQLLESANAPLQDGVLRNQDGILVVCCHTEMPAVTAQMVDWWFCWHLPFTKRYKLWHPTAHERSFVREDRTHLAGRTEYIGQTSNVDEYVGKALSKLAITFVEPETMGFDTVRLAKAKAGTAICARVGFRDKPIDTGWLVHLIFEVSNGVEMVSRFWLGDIHLRIPLFGRLIHKKLNSADSRKRSVADHLGLDLLRHCSEEMNHLAAFLPALYQATSKTS